MRRVGQILTVLGLLCSIGGLTAWKTARARRTPLLTPLTALEEGHRPRKNYLQIARHVRLFPLVVYASAGKATGRPDTPLHFVYYPIVSANHPYLSELDRLVRLHGSLETVPPEVLFATTPGFTLLVRSDRFRQLRHLPREEQTSETLRGTISIGGLLEPERQMLGQSYPKVDLDRVMVLDENLRPRGSTRTPLVLAIGGALALLVGLGLWRAGRE